MELWIRSQNKEQLANIKGFIIVEDEIRGFNITNDYYELGKYKSKKRALEVLNEIQKLLTLNANSQYGMVGKTSVNYDFTMRVYEMPKE